MTIDNEKELSHFIQNHPYNFRHVPNSGNYIKSGLKNIYFPKNVILDKNGVIVSVKEGLPTITRYEKGEKVTKSLGYTYFEKELFKVLY